jgi:hypothetical protein
MKHILNGLILLVFISFSAKSQIVIPDKLIKESKKTINEYSTKEAQKKMDKEIERSFGHIEKKYSKKAKKDSDIDEMNYNEILNNYIKNGVSSEPVKYEDKYVFTSSVSMEFKNITKNGKVEDKGNMISFFNPDEKYTAYKFMDMDNKSTKEGEAGIFILDYKNKATLMLSDDDGGSGIAYGMDDDVSDETINETSENNTSGSEVAQGENPLLKKTGKTKTISGYKCEEYKYDDKNISARLWITKDLKWDNHGLLQKAFSVSIYSNAVPNGFLMESETKDKTTGNKILFRVTEINKNTTATFNMADYNITNIGKVQLPEGTDLE